MIVRRSIAGGSILGPFHRRITQETGVIDHVGGNSGFRLRVEWNLTQEINKNITFINVDIFFISSNGFAITHSNNHRTCTVAVTNQVGHILQNWSWNNLNANINRGRENLIASRTFEIEHDENGRAPGSTWVPDELGIDPETNEEYIITPGHWDDGRLRINCAFGVNIIGLVGTVDLNPDGTIDNLIRIPNIEKETDIIPRMPDLPTGASDTTSTRSWVFPNNLDIIIDPKSPEFHHEVEIQMQDRDDHFRTIKKLLFHSRISGHQETILSSNFNTDENTIIANFLSGFDSRQTRFIIRTFTSTRFEMGTYIDQRQIGEEIITSVGVVTPPVPIVITADRFEITGPQTRIPIIMDEMTIVESPIHDFRNVEARMKFQFLNENEEWIDFHNHLISREISFLQNETLNNNLIDLTSNRMEGYIRIITTTEYNGVEFPEPFESNPIECFYDIEKVRPIIGSGNITHSVNNAGIVTLTVPHNAFVARMGATLTRVSASGDGASSRSVSFPQANAQQPQVNLVFSNRTTNSGMQNFVITAFDSRGNFFTRQLSINVGTFSNSIIFGHVERIENSSDVIIGCYGNCSDEGHIDTMYRYKIEDGKWSEPSLINCNGRKKGKWVSEKLTINIPIDKNAEFEFMLKDNSDCDQEWVRSPRAQINTATPALHIDPNRNVVSVGQLPHSNIGINHGIHTRNIYVGGGGNQGVHNGNTHSGPRIVLNNNDTASNDWGLIYYGGSGNDGQMIFETHDDGNEPFIFRQRASSASGNTTRTLTLMDGSGNSSFPGSISATGGMDASNLRGTIHHDRIPWGGGVNQVPRGDHTHTLAQVGQGGDQMPTGSQDQGAFWIGRFMIVWGIALADHASVGAFNVSSTSITYRHAFAHIPAVVATARNSGVPGFGRNNNNQITNGILGWSFNNTSPTGTVFHSRRSGTTNNTYSWIAVGLYTATTRSHLQEDWIHEDIRNNYIEAADKFSEEIKNDNISDISKKYLRTFNVMMEEECYAFNEKAKEYIKKEVVNHPIAHPGMEEYEDPRINKLESELADMKKMMAELLAERNKK